MYGAHSATWKTAMAALWSFADTHGGVRTLPAGCVVDGVALSRWVSTRRHDHRTGALDPDQVTQLEAVPGWSWGISAQQRWATTYAVLCAHAAEHGTAHVPATHTCDGVHLGAWVARQRSQHRHGTLPSHRADALQRLPGWVWTPRS